MAEYRRPGVLGLFDPEVIDTGTMCRRSSAMPGPLGLPSRFILEEPVLRDEDGLQIVLTPIQLAAILQEETLNDSVSLSNRLWGAASVVGGALELIGAAALLLTPEPTTVTKVAGGVLGAHGADTASAGLTQVVTGRATSTMTSSAARASAEALGADPKMAKMIGIGVDLAVPLVAGLAGAAKVLAVRRGAISLEAMEGPGLGHTIKEHVGKTQEQLRQRLANKQYLEVASTFRDLGQAERAVGEALRANRHAIAEWAKTAKEGAKRPFPFAAGRNIGFGVVRETGKVEQMRNLVVVLKKVQDSDRVYFVLTAYPKL